MPSTQSALDSLLAATRLQNRFLCDPRLNPRVGEALDVLLQLSQSECGLIGELELTTTGVPTLRTLVISNLATTNLLTQRTIREDRSEIELHSLDACWQAALRSGQPTIDNVAPARDCLPSGLPELYSLLMIPLTAEEETVGMVVLGNRRGGYEASLCKTLEPLTAACASMLWAARSDRKRRQAEDVLLENERHLKAVSDLVTHATFAGTIDQNGTITFHWYRGEPSDMPIHVPIPLLDLMRVRMDEENIEKGRQALARAMQGGEVSFNYQATGPDGTLHWFECRARTSQNASESNGMITLHGAIIDITSQTRYKLELEERNRFIEQVSALTPNFLYVFDWDRLRPVYLNRKTRDFLGYDESTSPEVFSLTDFMHPDDLARFPEHLERLRKLPEGEIVEFTYRLRQRGGAWRWMLSRDMAFERHPDGSLRHTIGTSIDITTLVQSEEALRNLVLRNNALLRAIPDLMFLLTADGIFTDFHSTDISRLMVPPELFLGRKVSEVMPPQLAENWEAARIAALTDGKVHRFEYSMEFQKELRQFEARVVRCDEAQVLVIARDVTELHQANVALRHSEETYRRLVETSRDLIWSVDREARWTFVNRDAVQRILGYEPEELIGQRFTDLLTPEQAVLDLQAFASLFTGHSIFGNRTELRRKDGSLVQLEYNAIPLRNERQEVIGTTGTASDITERLRAEMALRESEGRFRQFAAGIEHILWMANPAQGLPIFVNRVYEAVFGRTLDELFARPQSWMDAVVPEDRSLVEEAIARLPEGPRRIEFRIVRSDGAVRWLRSWGLPIRSESGEIYMFAGIIEDITEQKQATEQLATQQAELAHVSRLSTLGQMVAAVAHEITQPLSAVANYAAACEQLAKSQGGVSDNATEMIHNISVQAERAGVIIQQLRSFSRRTQQHRALQEVNAIVRDSVALLLLDHRQRISIAFDLADSLPRVFVDRVQLQQVLINLVKNACEAGDEIVAEPNRILIRTALAGRHVVVEVRDSGPGLATLSAEHLFQPFFTTKPQGLGMGLAICRTIVESHGGSIQATNVPEGGACFRVTLPIGE